MDRRRFLLVSLATGGSLTIGRGLLAPAFAAPAEPGQSPYGPLGEPDANGVRMPEGFTSRIIKEYGRPIGPTTEIAMPFPDGATTFPTADGGWILVSNSENPPPSDVTNSTPLGLDPLGGVQAIVFAADGTMTDAYTILDGSRSNCAGGATPWGTWLSCEEVEDEDDAANSGKVFECDPTGQRDPVDLPKLGRFKHENATVDPVGRRLYLSEDLDDGLFYRFTPTSYPDLTDGVLEAAVLDGTSVSWVTVPDPACADGVACRQQVEATPFNGGEGCVYDGGMVFLTTKNDDRVWVYDTRRQTMEVLYDAADFQEPVLTGVDHIIVQPGTGHLVVAEDGGDMEAVMITRDTFTVFPVVQLTGPQHGFPDAPSAGDARATSEVTGLAFNPAGDRLYLSSQRGYVGGVTYEITGPWVEALRPRNQTPAVTAPRPSGRPGGVTSAPRLPATGGDRLSPWTLGAAAGAAGLVALRQRAAATADDEGSRPDGV